MPTSATKRGSGGVSGPSTADMASSQIETTIVDPKELDKMKKSVLGKEQAPALSEMTPDQNTWSQFRDQLGPPFDSERVTMTQCRQIRKDPMVAFGLHYLKVPLARAEWHIDAYDSKGPNPQVAAFVDACLRKIYARFILQRSLAKDFGYQGITKRFIWENPGGFYIDPQATDPAKQMKPAWDEGEVLPIIWKQPVALRPETTLPLFDDKTGEFKGIQYTAPQGVGRRKAGGGKQGGSAQGVQEYDIYHSYWVANMKDDEHGSMYGYPLVGFARDYWWAYRFLFMMSNRAYERLAIPPVLAYHPEGSTLVDAETQEMRPNWEIALEAAERLRSNAVAAVPSTMATAGLDASATQREWDFKFMETPYEALTVFNERFNYINVMKLRCVTADTPVDAPRDYLKHPDGIPIKDLKPGQLIWTFNTDTRQFELNPVKKAACTQRNKQVFKVSLSNGHSIRATSNHPFLTTDLRWVKVADLGPGDKLVEFQTDIERYVKLDPTRGMRHGTEAKEYRHVARAVYGDLDGMEVHHSSERHADSSEGNLELMEPREHRRLTMTGNRLGEESRALIAQRKSASKEQARRLAIAAKHAEDDVLLAEADEDTPIWICPDCEREFVKRSNRQERCQGCRIEHNVNWQREYDYHGRQRRTEAPSWAEKADAVEVLSVTPDGVEDVWDVAIDTDDDACRSFVSRGVVLHNSVWVPELAFIGNGVGGNSAGNIAEQMANVLVESQALEMDECDEDINRLWIPQLLTLNFPDFINNGGVAKKISHGFRKEDVEFYKQIIQLLGQTNPELLAQVDLVEVLRRIGTPIKSPDALEAERQRLATQAAAGAAPAVIPQRGALGVIRNPNANPGVTSGGSSPNPTPFLNGNAAIGFEQPMVYVYGGETSSLAAHFSDSGTDEFLSNLPHSKHYRDRAIRSFMLQLRRLWLSYYRNLFPEFAAHVGQAKLELSDLALEGEEVFDGQSLHFMFANGDSASDRTRRVTAKAADKMARHLLRTWGQSSEKLAQLRDRSQELLRKVLERQMVLDQRTTNLKADIDAKADDIDQFLNEQVGRLIRLTQSTVKDELRAFLIAQIREGKTNNEIADEIRAHFSGFEGAKADRVARSEIRDVVNAATLLTGEAMKLRYTRASDGHEFDAECSDRDGKLFTIREAWRELRREHPYGTLGFDLIPRMSFSIQSVVTLPPGAGDDPAITAWYDSNTDTAYMLMDQPQEDKEEFLFAVAEHLVTA